MDANLNRWLVSGVWLAAVLALVSASTQGAIGVAAMWALPAALAATMAALGWPEKPMSRIVAGMGLVWQLALIGAYWPFAHRDDGASVLGPMTWPTHALVILAVLAALALSFVAMFLLPALGLSKRLKLATESVPGPAEETFERVVTSLQADPELTPLWKEYIAQLYTTQDEEGRSATRAMVSARAVFDLPTVTQSRLRLDLFRNLPGVFTGIGIIGTFSGLIMGLRTFRISQDPQVVQKSLELLMAGVWEAFLVSALAITLAITVTLIEKIVMTLVMRRLDRFALALDEVFPPQPQPQMQAQGQGLAPNEAWMPRLINALDALVQGRGATAAAQPAVAGLPGTADAPAMVMQGAEFGMPQMPHMPHMQSSAAAVPNDLLAQLMDMSQQTRLATNAMADLAGSLPAALAQQFQGSSQTQQQSVQAMRALSARLEGVASGIEVSGRKTLETVASRLMQSEAQMNGRHHAVVESLAELVQRIETLCGLLQQDRHDGAGGHSLFDAPVLEGSGFELATYGSDNRRGNPNSPPPNGRRAARPAPAAYEDFNDFDDAGYSMPRESDSRYDRGGDGGSFGT
jgi:MotA/TolQ/ExbB proton channel family